MRNKGKYNLCHFNYRWKWGQPVGEQLGPINNEHGEAHWDFQTQHDGQEAITRLRVYFWGSCLALGLLP